MVVELVDFGMLFGMERVEKWSLTNERHRLVSSFWSASFVKRCFEVTCDYILNNC